MSGFELRFEAPMRLLAALPCVLLVILFALTVLNMQWGEAKD